MNDTNTTNHWSRWVPAVALGLAGLTAIGATACSAEDGSGDIVTITLSSETATPVTSIVLDADMDVRVVVDPDITQAALLRIDDNLVDNIDASIDSDGELYVGYDDALIGTDPTRQPELVLSVKSLESIENKDDGTITISGVDEADLDIANEADGRVEVIA